MAKNTAPDPAVLAAAADLVQRQQAVGARPMHRHQCPAPDGTTHAWLCPSPYCEPDTTMPGTLLTCPGHGAEYPRGTRMETFISA